MKYLEVLYSALLKIRALILLPELVKLARVQMNQVGVVIDIIMARMSGSHNQSQTMSTTSDMYYSQNRLVESTTSQPYARADESRI